MEKFEDTFPHSFLYGEYGIGKYPKAVEELDLINLSAEIREKENWSEKFKNPTIISKWKSEISDRISESEAKLAYVLEELSYYTSLKDGLIEVAAVDGTWQADNLIDDALKQSLISEVSILEDIPEAAKDWHPGSNDQILDLVHPSLFCFVEGRTRVTKQSVKAANSLQDISRIGSQLYFSSEENFLTPEEVTELAFRHTTNYPAYCKSKKFQWLPSEFQVKEDGSVKIASYINNLHPNDHENLYHCLEKVFEKFVPLFNKVLTDLRNPKPNRIKVGSWYEEDTTQPDKEESNDNNSDEDFESSQSQSQQNRTPIPPEIPKFSLPDPPKTIVNLAGRTLQVIVKLANIQLTPDKPKYRGGTWHIEGMVNEQIVASGIYYYSCDNITKSVLQFRQAVQEPDYEQDDRIGVSTIYGMNDEEPMCQKLGGIVTKEGRCIAFPNTLQHWVAPFRLEDATRPGHRKILVFFLVDPTVNIISTARVPPQQKSWFLQEVVTQPLIFPAEIIEKIIEPLDWPMSLEEAKKHRDDLMAERKYFMKKSNNELFERPFSLCEH